MKIHKQIVLIEEENSYLEVISFYDTKSKKFGADIYHEAHLAETHGTMEKEPIRDYLLSLGYSFIMSRLKKD